MATYTSNTTIKIQGAVSGTATSTATGTSAGSLTTAYTCPAGIYALVNIAILGTSNTRNLYIGGMIYWQSNSSATSAYLQATVGPGQTVQIQAPAAGGGAGAAIANVTGVEFINTP